MGWTSTRYTHCTHSQFDNDYLKEFLQREFYDAQFALVHLDINPRKGDNHVCYAIMRNRPTSPVFICVILINIENDEIYWKEISEDMGPCESKCPVELFKFVPCPTDGYAKEWREKCTKRNAKLNRVEL